MRIQLFAAALLLAAPVASVAAPPAAPAAPAEAAPPPTPPRIFVEAGYSEPDITPGFCKNVDPQRTTCTVPAMTAGRYFIQAEGTSTATAADAVQQLTIVAGDVACTQVTRRPDPKVPWPVGQKNTLKGGCVVTLVTDNPLVVGVLYADAKATKDPKGPALSLRRLPWDGVIANSSVTLKQ